MSTSAPGHALLSRALLTVLLAGGAVAPRCASAQAQETIAATRTASAPPAPAPAVPARDSAAGARSATIDSASRASVAAPGTNGLPAPRVAAAGDAPAPGRSAPRPPAAPAAASTSIPATAPGGAPAIVPADLANPFVQRAVSYYEQGRTDAALAEYRKGIASDPLDSDTWYGLAELLRDLGLNRQAVETYTLALATIEHAPELRVPFAELLMENKRKPDAIKVLQRGIELDPDASAEMKAMLGNVVLGVLDDSMTEGAPAAGAGKARSTSASRARARAERRKRKKLCKLFCAGAFDPIAPKP